MSHNAVSAADVITLTKKMGNLLPDMALYLWRNDGEDFMLRTALLKLRDEITDVLQRSARADQHKRGDVQ